MTPSRFFRGLPTDPALVSYIHKWRVARLPPRCSLTIRNRRCTRSAPAPTRPLSASPKESSAGRSQGSVCRRRRSPETDPTRFPRTNPGPGRFPRTNPRLEGAIASPNEPDGPRPRTNRRTGSWKSPRVSSKTGTTGQYSRRPGFGGTGVGFLDLIFPERTQQTPDSVRRPRGPSPRTNPQTAGSFWTGLSSVDYPERTQG
jgi:hypothetical protein